MEQIICFQDKQENDLLPYIQEAIKKATIGGCLFKDVDWVTPTFHPTRAR